MSVLSLLNSLVLRETINPPLTTKGSDLTFAELDAWAVKLYNAIQDIVSGGNVPAYDAGATYDGSSTLPEELYSGYDTKIWKAVSAAPFSGQTPAEGIYWTQITLAQLLGNPIALTKIAQSYDINFSPDTTYETEWFSSSEKDVFTNPLTAIAAQGVDIACVPVGACWMLDAGGVVFDFGATGLHVAYDSDPTQKLCGFANTYINSAVDVYRNVVGGAANIAFNDKVIITASADATVGDGVYYYKIFYKKITKPF